MARLERVIISAISWACSMGRHEQCDGKDENNKKCTCTQCTHGA